ncbi:Dihydrofolate synthetase [Nakaseomyces bracarensis]|uniref:Dihydrofolate synthetase n=1 Tax=Nakaseomyces bracarensis TaxID=273131 RepID=A0ABR4NMZ7_9SACH
MSIRLGLGRVSSLLSHIGNPQQYLKVLHIAGTNGKGSVCTYLSSVLAQQKTQNRVGKFTTPHLVHVTESISVDNVPIPNSRYLSIREKLDKVNQEHQLSCTEFELLTCAAVQYFKEMECHWCVIEVGLGGREDATNVIPGARKLCCGITKIGLDHESFLGNTLEEIAREKVGIVTEGVECAVVDGSNDKIVIDTVREHCTTMSCKLLITDGSMDTHEVRTVAWGILEFNGKLPLNGEYQIFNLRVALSILDQLQRSRYINVTNEELMKGLNTVQWPGRLHDLEFCFIQSKGDERNKKMFPVLIDGAHNGSAAVELSKHLRKTYGDKPLTFIIAVTAGKNLNPLLAPLLRPHDHVYTTKFSSVDGMPWIQPTDPNDLCKYIKSKMTDHCIAKNSLYDVFQELSEILDSDSADNKRPLVVCGSLYLCGELLRIHNLNCRSK